MQPFIFVALEVDYTNTNTVPWWIPSGTFNGSWCKNYEEGVMVAKELADQGVKAIELCAGFGNEGTAMV